VAPRELAASMVKLRLEDVGRMHDEDWKAKFTFAAYDLAKLDTLYGAMDRLGAAISGKWAAASTSFADAGAGSWEFSDNFRDLGDVCRHLVANPGDPAVGAAAQGALDALGYLEPASDKTSVRIVSDKPGSVIWGVNGWKSPPDVIRPAGSKPFF